MTRSRALTLTAFSLALLLWAYFIFAVPTLDFDEALYRSVVGRMKAAHDPWLLSWDGRSLFHKPPVFYWLVWICSYVVDGANAAVSTAASRLPSLFSTIGILVYLFFSGKRFQDAGLITPTDFSGSTSSGLSDHSATTSRNPIGKNAALAFLCGFFPLLTATSVLLDPLQTLCLMPALVIPTLLFFQNGELKRRDWILWGVSLFAANATKGLNGMVVPTIAFGFHILSSLKSYGFKKASGLVLKFLMYAFLPALFLTGLYYGILDHQIGPAFTHEFIWVQHFERGTSAMEEHSGSFFYHFFVVFFGGGVLIPLFLDRASSVRAGGVKYGFPLTYALSFIVIFGLSATKLPHYSWPVWPAIALYVGLISALPVAETKAEAISYPAGYQRKRYLNYLPILFIGVFAASLAFFPALIPTLTAKSPSFAGVMKYFTGFSLFETGLFLVAAALCFVFEVKKDKFIQSIESCAILSTLIALCFSVGLTRTITQLMVTPFYEIADSIKKDGAGVNDCIRYSGALSPTFSLALAPELLHNRCEPEAMKYLVAPEWKVKECQERNFKVIDQKTYLVLCKKG